MSSCRSFPSLCSYRLAAYCISDRRILNHISSHIRYNKALWRHSDQWRSKVTAPSSLSYHPHKQLFLSSRSGPAARRLSLQTFVLWSFAMCLCNHPPFESRVWENKRPKEEISIRKVIDTQCRMQKSWTAAKKWLKGRGIDWHLAFSTWEGIHFKQQALTLENWGRIYTPKTNQLRVCIGFGALISKGLWVCVT